MSMSEHFGGIFVNVFVNFILKQNVFRVKIIFWYIY